MRVNGSPLIRLHHAGDVTVKVNRQLGPRRLNDYEIVYFPRASRTTYEVNGETYLLEKPCALVTKPGDTHCYLFDDGQPTRHLFLHFEPKDDSLASRYPRLLVDGAPPVPVSERSLLPQLMKHLLYLFYEKPPRWRLQTEMLLLTALEELEAALHLPAPAGQFGGAGQAEEALPPQISNALRHIEAHANEPLDVERLARDAGWSHEHFTRTFRRHVGHSPKAWMTRRKMERAAQLLLQRSDSAKQIAHELGFADEYYFHRLFRRVIGMTASDYRRKYGDPRLREMAPPDDWGRFYPLNHIFVVRDNES